MAQQTRQAFSPRKRPTGSTLEEFSSTCGQSFDEVWLAIERLETNSLMSFEGITLSGTWAAASSTRTPAAKFLAADTIVLLGRLTNPTAAAHTSAIGILQEPFWPRFPTKVVTAASDTLTVIPVILTIAANGVITPTWAAAPTGAYQLIFDNLLVHLA